MHESYIMIHARFCSCCGFRNPARLFDHVQQPLQNCSEAEQDLDSKA